MDYTIDHFIVGITLVRTVIYFLNCFGFGKAFSVDKVFRICSETPILVVGVVCISSIVYPALQDWLVDSLMLPIVGVLIIALIIQRKRNSSSKEKYKLNL